jgi:hypothetical protein
MGCGYFQDKTNIKSIRLDKDHSPVYYGTMNRIIKRTNPFSGKSEMLTHDEAMLHDQVKQAEAMGEFEKMQKCLDKFSRLNPKAYMTLLD